MFYLGAPEPTWLARSASPLMVSRTRCARRRAPLPRAGTGWYLDSAAFSELEQHGRWTLTAAEWAKLATRWGAEAGQLDAVAIQDWLCTPPALERTGLSVADHQALTLGSFLQLRDLAPDLPWVPTLQGWTPEDYLRHADLYVSAGVDLAAERLVGVGSIALRQHGDAAAAVVVGVNRWGLTNLHAYGAKELGLRRWGWAVASADSMAWSTVARREGRKGSTCTEAHTDCRNCLAWAEEWGASVTQLVGGPPPPALPLF